MKKHSFVISDKQKHKITKGFDHLKCIKICDILGTIYGKITRLFNSDHYETIFVLLTHLNSSV